MQDNNIFRNKRGQASEGLTWIVATGVIVIMSIAFIFVSDLMGKSRGSLIYSVSESGLEDQESLFALMEMQKNEKKVIGLLKERELDTAREIVKEILENFKKENIYCDFRLSELIDGKRTGDSIFISNGASGEKEGYFIFVDNNGRFLEVGLRC